MLWAVTGGAGFLGVHLVRRLLADGERVRTLDLEPLAEPGAEAILGDVRSAERAGGLCRGADVLVHAAAALPIRGSRGEIRSVNVEGTRSVLAAAAAAGVGRIVFVSSAVVYGARAVPPLTEDSEPAGAEAYGRSKLAAERLCGESPLEAIVLRPQAFVGPGRLGIFGVLFQWIREGRRIYTLGSGLNRYQLLAVEDLVEAVLLAARKPAAGGTYNLGAGEFGTVAEELRGLIVHAGSASRLVALPARPARALLRALDLAGLSPLSEWHYETADRDFFLDCSRAGRELGWRPSRSTGEALRAAYDWFLASGQAGRGRTHRVLWREGALGLVRRLS